MKKFEEKKFDFLGIYQILGGLTGIAYFLFFLFTAKEFNGALILLIMAILPFLFSIYCGYMVSIKKNFRALQYSSINQILQIISFSIAGFGYQYVSGLMISIGVDYTNDFLFTMNSSISNFRFNINSDKEVLTLQINLVAVFLVFYIDKMKKAIT